MIFRPLILTLLLCATLLHFVQIEADFPQGMNWSGDLYTDEGVYTGAALAYTATGQWYRPNEYNNAISQPVGHLLHGLVFAIFGASLFSARLTILLCFVQILILFYLLTKRYVNEMAAYVVVALLATNFYLFAFSRLAILDIIMCYFILLGLSIVLLVPKIRISTLIIAALCLILATLTKYSGIIGLVPLAYAIWARTPTMARSQRLVRVAIPMILCGATVLLYLLWARASYPNDFQTYQDALTMRSESTLIQLLLNPYRTLRATAKNDLLLAIFALLLIPASLLTLPSYRNSPLVQVLGTWFITYYLLLCLLNYQPPRYFIMLNIPMIALVGLALAHMGQTLHQTKWLQTRGKLAPTVMLALVIVITGVNLSRVANYLSHLEYTFINMAREVASTVKQDSSTTSPLIIGNFSASLSLATGIPYVNSGFSNLPLAQRLQAYPPTHYVALGEEKETVEQLDDWYNLEHLQSFDVFHNYIKDQPVHLYRLLPKSSP